MAGLNGRDVKVAFTRATAWGTPASVTKQINLKSLDGFQAKPGVVVDESFNQSFVGQGEMGDYEPSTPELQMDLRYDGSGPLLIAAAMGSRGGAGRRVLGRGHVARGLQPCADAGHRPDEVLHVRGGLRRVRRGHELHPRAPHGQAQGVQHQRGRERQDGLSVPIVAGKAVYTSAVNTNSTVHAAAVDPLANRVFRKQGVFRVNLQSAGSLAAGDALQVKEVVIGTSRPLADADHVFGLDYIIEPDDDGWSEFPVELVFPRMNTANANSLVIAWPSGTHLKADMTFTGNYINSTTQYGMLFQFPALQISEWDAPLTGHNQIRPTAKAVARLATAAPTGMAFTQPLQSDDHEHELAPTCWRSAGHPAGAAGSSAPTSR